MPRGKQIIKTIQLEECTLGQAKEEFYKNNKVKGLAKETQRGYQNYIDHFAKWCGEDNKSNDDIVNMFDACSCSTFIIFKWGKRRIKVFFSTEFQ